MEIKGKIEWLPPTPTEFPKESGNFNIGIKIQGEFYNLHRPIDKLKKMLDMLKVGFEVKLKVEGNRIEDLEVTSDKIAAPESNAPGENSPGANSDIVNISGKNFMTYKGLLKLAHAKDEDFSMELTESWVSEDMKMAWCKVRLTAGKRIFDGFGSSTPENTKVMTASHPVEMCHTRAKGRALRDYLNIGEAMAEELAK